MLALLLGFSCLFALNTAVGRVCLGPGSAGSARYVPYVVPGWVAVVIAARTRARASARWALLSPVLVLITLRTFNVRGEEVMGQRYADGKRRWAACYRQRHDIHLCDGDTAFPVYPDPPATRMQEKLDFLEARRLNLFQPQ